MQLHNFRIGLGNASVDLRRCQIRVSILETLEHVFEGSFPLRLLLPPIDDIRDETITPSFVVFFHLLVKQVIWVVKGVMVARIMVMYV